ncbi:MAG: helix-turn-helix domain-containing protein [Clostridium celatum]|nr:helix-turn-helix domain-containing protein [Clostridium celatum]
MNKMELKSFLETNVNGEGDIDRDVVIVTGKKQGSIVFNLMPYGRSGEIGFYDEELKIFNRLNKINDLEEFIDMLDKEYNILYTMTTIDKIPYYYNNSIELEDIMTINEAAKMWNVLESNIRYHINNGKLVSGIEYRKAGRITLITKRGMIKLFGDMPEGEAENE